VIRILIAERQIFVGREAMRAEAIADFVVIRTVLIVVENPAGVLAAARPMRQHAELLSFAAPEAADATSLAMRLPQPGIDMAVGVQRSAIS
jgi:hypothetical protein